MVRLALRQRICRARKQPIVPLGAFASDKIGEIGNLEKPPSAHNR